jgi:hypothetical protein
MVTPHPSCRKAIIWPGARYRRQGAPHHHDGAELSGKAHHFTLPTLLDSKFVALHIEGDDKMKALDAAQKPGPVPEMPIRASQPRARLLALRALPQVPTLAKEALRL